MGRDRMNGEQIARFWLCILGVLNALAQCLQLVDTALLHPKLELDQLEVDQQPQDA